MNPSNNYSIFLQKILTNSYDRYMKLKIYIEDKKLMEKYIEHVNNHNSKLINDMTYADSGFDIMCPKSDNNNEHSIYGGMTFYGPEWADSVAPHKIDFKIKCSAEMVIINNGREIVTHNTGYYLYPRSSLSKTKLRLANSVGIIDSGYRGNLIGMFDLVNLNYKDNDDKEYDEIVAPYTRLLQICAPNLAPIYVEIVNNIEELGEKTKRNEGGFGSTGV